MHRPFRIVSFSAEALDIPLLEPFGISGGAQAAANNVLVRLELEDGSRGWGEAAPLPPYNGETQGQALAALKAARPWLEGWRGSDWRALAVEFRTRGGGGCGSAQCAFETALVDALARRAGSPLWGFLAHGAAAERAARPDALETDMTVTTGTVAQAAASAKAIRDRGIRLIKVKVGGKGGSAHDLARLAAIHEVAPGAPLIIDGNAGVPRADARELVLGLRRLGITPAVLEQWLAKGDHAGARELAEFSGWPVAADESVTTAAEARAVVAERAAQIINIKLMKAGLAEVLDIAAVAREAGLGLMIGGNVESILAMTTSACFAIGQGGFRYADLDTPLFLAANPFAGGYRLDGGRISVAHIASGHGVTPAATAPA